MLKFGWRASMLYQDTIIQLLNGDIHTGLNPAKRKYWPHFAYHFTDIDNAIDILNRGMLVSRERAEKYDAMKNDNASDSVINHTSIDVKRMVRLYFRPRTPTQYYNEGFQTALKRDNSKFQANCPVPTFFLFDLSGVLELPKTQFSDKSLATHDALLMKTPEEFNQLPFDEIYHDSGMVGLDSKQKNEITQHKHAEIVVPDSLDLRLLKLIYVRSMAEKTTLLDKLHMNRNFIYDPLVQLGDESTFYMDRNFIYSVDVNETSLIIQSKVKDPYPKEWGDSTSYAVNPDNQACYLNVVIKISVPDGRVFSWPNGNKKALLHEKMSFRWRVPLPEYQVEIWIDDHIAYSNHFEQIEEKPF
ncbi:hypothetical protein CEW82_02555 [Lactiplantibacillus pentosus]|nr:hypothetical protein CEW82_02555 [Lactiplantibacillus pentosus]